MDKQERGRMENRLRATLRPVFTVLAVFLALFQVYTTGGIAIFDGTLQKVSHLSLVLALAFLWVPVRKFRKSGEPAYCVVMDIFLALLALGIGTYYFFNASAILERVRYVDPVTNADMLFGCIAVLLTMEVTRRTAGMPLVIVGACFMLYALFGQDIPGPFRHNGVTFDALVEQLFLGTDGLFGLPLAAASTMIYAFIMFGAFLERSNMSSIFMELACLLTRKSQGGPAKVSIFASALFGTISGSSAGNVYTTGVFTIPLMKSCGYQPHFAGAVEAVASTGGQIMPPVMGAAAFMMAEFCGVSYLEVAKAALLPALLYYLALWVMIHFEARRRGLGLISSELVPSLRSILRRLYFLAPLVILVAVMIDGRSAAICANMATGSILLLSSQIT